jgi:hypothetical protein
MPDLSIFWSEWGQPLFMAVIFSMIVGWGFRIGWLFADLIRRNSDK